MGCLSSKELNDEDRVSNSIDLKIKQDSHATRDDIKLLLLGAGESGKTTIKTQMRYLEGIKLSDAERDQFTDVCRTNMVSSMQTILDAMLTLGIELGDSSIKDTANFIVDLPNKSGGIGIDEKTGQLLPEVEEAIEVLWRNPGVQECFGRSNEYQLNDSAEYFLASCSRISSPSWKPTDMDVLKARVKTTGISETRFRKSGKNFVVVDVGGQRSERRKWLHCFEGVTALLYVVALNEYNMMLREDESVNRMSEAHQLFTSIVTSPYFRSTPIILFLNKADLLRRKCKSVATSPNQDIKLYYPGFTGDSNDWRQVFRFIENMFMQVGRTRVPSSGGKEVEKATAPAGNDLRKDVYAHTCTAVDQENMKAVLASVADILLRDSIQASGLV